MKKTLPIVISASALLLIAGSLGFAFRNNIKPQTVKAEQYQVEFTKDDIDLGLVDIQYEGTYADFMFAKQTPKGNEFGTEDAYVYGDGTVAFKTGNYMFTLGDTYGYGYYGMSFTFNLSMATFDHITFVGEFVTNYSNPTTTYSRTYTSIDTEGSVNCYEGGLLSAKVTKITVVYSC